MKINAKCGYNTLLTANLVVKLNFENGVKSQTILSIPLKINKNLYVVSVWPRPDEMTKSTCILRIINGVKKNNFVNAN